jgi:hypothetical protein
MSGKELSASQAGEISLGNEISVHRQGYGAMRRTGEGVWGPPTDRKAALATVYRAMLPRLRESSNARIVNVSSGVGSLTDNATPDFAYRPIFGPVYPASKAAQSDCIVLDLPVVTLGIP